MATFNKFNQFHRDILSGVHNFNTDVFKVMLTNVAPLPGNQILADITEITTGSGYSAGGTATAVSVSVAGGVTKVFGTTVTFSSSGTIGPFQYAVLYNATQTSPIQPLVGWWDYESPITLFPSDTFAVSYNVSNGIFTVS